MSVKVIIRGVLILLLFTGCNKEDYMAIISGDDYQFWEMYEELDSESKKNSFITTTHLFGFNSKGKWIRCRPYEKKGKYIEYDTHDVVLLDFYKFENIKNELYLNIAGSKGKIVSINPDTILTVVHGKKYLYKKSNLKLVFKDCSCEKVSDSVAVQPTKAF